MTSSPESSRRSMCFVSASDQLLFGVVALQNNSITREQLVAGFKTWVQDKSRTLVDILQSQRSLAPQDSEFLNRLVVKFREKHGGNALQGLAALSALSQVAPELERLNDPDLTASLARVGGRVEAERSLEATQIYRGAELQDQVNGTGTLDQVPILWPNAQGGSGQASVVHDQKLNREDRRLPPPTSAAEASTPPEAAAEIPTRSWAPELADTIRVGEPVEAGTPRIQKLGRFELREVLGQGAFGTVYRAYDPQLDRTVGLKVPRSGTLIGPDEIARFFREARAAAQLRHPHIVPVHDAGQIGAFCYIAAEFVDGTTLRHRLKNKPALTFRETAVLIAQLASALHYAHNKGIVHRDVKPENVMLTKAGVPQIMDFGLARRDEGDQLRTQEGTRMGTPAYMSPEQAEGKSHLADARSDLWSLGVILFEMLCGRRPFDGRGMQLIQQILEHESPSPRRFNSAVPRDLETTCLKCLAKAPEQRYPSCQHLADDLHNWLEYKPILARRTGVLPRAAKWARRNPLGAAIVLGLSAATVGLAAYQQTRPAYLDLHVTPPMASVQLDGAPVVLEDGSALVARRPGRYGIQVTAADFLPYTADVVLVRGRDNAATTRIELKSIFGYFEVDTQPSGAALEVKNGSGRIVARGTTPFRSSALAAGSYTLNFKRDMYLPARTQVDVPNGFQTAKAGPVAFELAVTGAHSHQMFSTSMAFLRKPLASDVKLEFVDLPLEDALSVIAKVFDVRFMLDKPTLTNEGVALNQPITMKNASGSSLHQVLSRVLWPVQLGYYEEGGKVEGSQGYTFVITTQARVHEMMLSVLYPVGDLLEGQLGMSGNQLVNLIEANTAVQSWESLGGPGSMSFIPQARSLHVRNSFPAHQEIDDYLANLREARAANAKLVAEPAPTTPVADLPDLTATGTEREIEIELASAIPAIGPGVSTGTGWGYPLTIRPAKPLRREPAYKTERPRYGAITLRVGDDPLYVFAYDDAASKIYFDCNNDNDLTNDGEIDFRGKSACLANVVLSVPYPNGAQPYQLNLIYNPQQSPWFRCQSDTGRRGELRIGDGKYAVTLLDYNCDGRFDDLHNVVILIDLDGDGQYDGGANSAEFYFAADRINIAGTIIEVASISVDGMKMMVRHSRHHIPERAILKPGFAAPDFEGLDDGGEKFRLRNLRGKVVLLHFWSARHPKFADYSNNVRALQKYYPPADFELIGVPLDDDIAAIKNILSKDEWTHHQVFTPAGQKENPAASAFRANLMSQAVLINREGGIVGNVDLSLPPIPVPGGQSRPPFANFIDTVVKPADGRSAMP